MKNKLLTRDKSFYKTILLLAIPMVFQNLITFSVSLADNIMIGHLGDNAVSGVYIGTQIQTYLQVISGGIEGGILLLAAQYWGRNDRASIRKVASIGVKFSALLGIVTTVLCLLMPEKVASVFNSDTDVIKNAVDYISVVCFSYIFFTLTQALIVTMRSIESARIGLTVSLFSLVVDIILNYVLIFGKLGLPVLGVKGAAIATLIARISEFIIIFVYVRFIDKKLRFRFSDVIHTDLTLLKDFIKYGFPIVAGQLVWGTNLAVGTIILGRLGAQVLTGTSLANTVNSMMYITMNGLSGAVGIVISKTVGSGDISKIKEYSRTVQLGFLAFGILTGSFFALICEPFISLYSISDSAAVFARQFIHVLCFTSVGTFYECGCLFGLVKSGGDVGFVFKNDTLFVFLVVIPSAIVTSCLGCPEWVIYLCLKCDQILKCFVAFVKIRKYNWMKNLTRKTV